MMPEFSPEAERLARVLWPGGAGSAVVAAQRAIDAGWIHRDDMLDAGWTPPPDPHEDIARALWARMDVRRWGDAVAQKDLLAAVRRIPDDLATQVADALRADQ